MPPSLFIAAARALAKLADPSDPAKGLLPDIDRLREVSATVAVDVINTATAAGIARVAGRRPDRGRPRGDVAARVPPDHALDRTRDQQDRSTSMAQTVAEILVDQMVEVGIRKVYGIVGDSANPIVDALRRHESDIEFVHVRNEEAGAFAAGADAQVSGRPTAVLGSSGPGQPAPGQRPVRLPAQRGAGVRHRDAHPQHRDRQRLLPGDQPRGDLLRLHQLRAP